LDLFDLRGTLETLGLGEVALRRVENADFALATEVLIGGKAQGITGQLSSAQSARVAGTLPVFVAEVKLPNESEAGPEAKKFRELQRFPSVSRDIALLAPAGMSHEEILRAIETEREPLLARIDLFDLFAGKDAENIGAGRKSLAYSLTYSDKNRTLTSDEVSAAHDRIRERLKTQLGVELRE
jgi:phenylalanyl-tRNA synthetase beta chain